MVSMEPVTRQENALTRLRMGRSEEIAVDVCLSDLLPMIEVSILMFLSLRLL
jgi:hypothetical protein